MQPGDRLILDDRGARALAQARNIPHTGLLGLLVMGVQAQRLEPNPTLDILSRLARTDFRMTVDLYDWAQKKIKDHTP